MTSLFSNAGYFPEWMVIRLPEKYRWIFNDEAEIPSAPEDKAREYGIFFHEWAHHFHNISTVSGILAYSSTVALWSSFRWTVLKGSDSIGSDSVDVPPDHQLNIVRAIKFFSVVRNEREINSKLNSSSRGFAFHHLDSDIATTSVAQLPSLRIGEVQPEEFHVLTCQARRARGMYSEENVLVEIGTFEIIEGVASMLEDFVVRTICKGAVPAASDFAPYQLLSRLVEHFIPGGDQNLAIACGIAALQHPDPPVGLLHILKEARATINSERFSKVEELAKEFLSRNLANVELHLTRLDQFFPVDEPMAEAVKWLNERIRERLRERAEDPFVELRLTREIADSPKQILATVVDRSCAFLFLAGSDGTSPSSGTNVSAPADMLELRTKYTGASEERFQHGRVKLWAALHFLHRHRGENGIDSSAAVVRKSATGALCCPFYYACDHQPRVNNDPNCTHAPWRVGIQSDRLTEICWYSAGAFASRRGPVV